MLLLMAAFACSVSRRYSQYLLIFTYFSPPSCFLYFPSSLFSCFASVPPHVSLSFSYNVFLLFFHCSSSLKQVISYLPWSFPLRFWRSSAVFLLFFLLNGCIWIVKFECQIEKENKPYNAFHSSKRIHQTKTSLIDGIIDMLRRGYMHL